uniref:Uncharacterized protein n=1 Tax=Helianthus annuus TaxID=4232 RepID=A0A251UV57_HELAN
MNKELGATELRIFGWAWATKRGGRDIHQTENIYTHEDIRVEKKILGTHDQKSGLKFQELLGSNRKQKVKALRGKIQDELARA